MNPVTVAEWRRPLDWWERQASELTKIAPNQCELSRAAQLLEHLVQHVPRSEFWRNVPEQDWKPALLAAMAQFHTESALSGAHEGNRKLLPPFDVCLQILNRSDSLQVRDLVYIILQKVEYPLTPEQRSQLERHFQGVTSSKLAQRTFQHFYLKSPPTTMAA
jgi:hypothetical protein